MSAEQCGGEITLITPNGDVEALDCTGALSITASKGKVSSRNGSGPQILECMDCKTIVDAPRAGVTVRQQGGDVRIMPLDGILGDYAITAENANISLLMPEGADARILATTHNGVVRSDIPLTGEISNSGYTLQGVPADGLTGRRQVVLTATNGDIVID